jgi:ribosomal protein S20
MPVTISAKKRVARNDRARVINRVRLGKFRAAEKTFRKFIATKDISNAQLAFCNAQSEFAKAVKHGLVHQNRCSAKTARFAQMLKHISISA